VGQALHILQSERGDHSHCEGRETWPEARRPWPRISTEAAMYGRRSGDGRFYQLKKDDLCASSQSASNGWPSLTMPDSPPHHPVFLGENRITISVYAEIFLVIQGEIFLARWSASDIFSLFGRVGPKQDNSNLELSWRFSRRVPWRCVTQCEAARASLGVP
jgi:hypothetical protein